MLSSEKVAQDAMKVANLEQKQEDASMLQEQAESNAADGANTKEAKQQEKSQAKSEKTKPPTVDRYPGALLQHNRFFKFVFKLFEIF